MRVFGRFYGVVAVDLRFGNGRAPDLGVGSTSRGVGAGKKVFCLR